MSATAARTAATTADVPMIGCNANSDRCASDGNGRVGCDCVICSHGERCNCSCNCDDRDTDIVGEVDAADVCRTRYGSQFCDRKTGNFR